MRKPLTIVLLALLLFLVLAGWLGFQLSNLSESSPPAAWTPTPSPTGTPVPLLAVPTLATVATTTRTPAPVAAPTKPSLKLLITSIPKK